MTSNRSLLLLLLASLAAVAKASTAPIPGSSLVRNFEEYVNQRRDERAEDSATDIAIANLNARGAGGDACTSHIGCSECAASSWDCHWCASDNACHAKGSIHGCISGAGCSNDDDGGGKNRTDNNSCSSYDSCFECAQSSWDCHWCAHDDACHAKGSVHGCVTGSSCNTPKKNDTEKNETACSSHSNCDQCAASSWGCHWCTHDDACHSKGSIHGCLVGESCGAKNNTEKNETACSSHSNCDQCAASSWGCHWCAYDDACHTKGSVHGCAVGASCDAPKKKNATDRSCAVHKACGECSLSSWGCHWCEHDNACHSVGSIHGCMSGVNCYDNDRCQRKEPEPIEQIVFTNIGFLPFAGILGLGLIICCCASLCLTGMCCVRGLYDDLSVLAGPYREVESLYQPPVIPPSNSGTVQTQQNGYGMEDGGGEREDKEVIEKREENDDNGAVEEATTEEYGLLLAGTEYDDDIDPTTRDPLIVTSTPSCMGMPYAQPRNIDCLYKGCKISYAVTVAMTFIFVIVAVVMFPKYPEYNVCNNQMAWKSIVDGMTSGSLKASIQLLMSVRNPNHFSVEIDMGTGSFKHDDTYVGSFEIPTSTIEAMSITDIYVMCTFTPEKWQALDLAEEYYRGTLKLNVDAELSVKVSALGGYTFQGGIDNYLVDTNDPLLQDRHLCACPTWKDKKKNDKPKPMAIGAFIATDH